MTDTKRKDVLEGLEGYTPGPWEAEDAPSAGWKIKAAVADVGDPRTLFSAPSMRDVSFRLGSDGKLYATLAYDAFVQFPSDDWKRATAANARLIARAPDLVEEIRELREALQKIAHDPAPENLGNVMGIRLQAIALRALLPDTEDSA